MIVRIATEGQYELLQGDEKTFHELDNQVVSACELRDEQQFHDAFARLLDFVRTNGQVSEDRLEPSDLILPPPDTSLEEARAEFTGEGLIPS